MQSVLQADQVEGRLCMQRDLLALDHNEAPVPLELHGEKRGGGGRGSSREQQTECQPLYEATSTLAAVLIL